MNSRPLAEILDELALRTLRVDDAVIELADASRRADLAALFAARTAVPAETAVAILGGEPEDRAAMLCRVAGLGLNGYSAVLRMRRRDLKVALVDPVEFLNAYLALAKAPPQDVLDALRGATALSEPAGS